jgi:hypothetical protein
LSGEGDRCAIVVVGGDAEGVGVRKVAVGWVVCHGDVLVLVAHQHMCINSGSAL